MILAPFDVPQADNILSTSSPDGFLFYLDWGLIMLSVHDPVRQEGQSVDVIKHLLMCADQQHASRDA